MSTTRSFNAMLNEYLPNDLLMEELIKRDYVLGRVEKDNNWKGGNLVVPFRGAGATSAAFGALTGSTDISEYQFVRGNVASYIELWGSLIFNLRDLMDHSGKIPESSFLRILPDLVDDFMDYMKQVASVQLTSGPHFATATDDTNAATGIFIVDKVDRFQIGQKCNIDDNDSSPLAVYVIGINLNTKAVTFSATRGGAAANLSAYSVAQVTVFYHDGIASQTDTFTSLRSALLSLANGGSTNLHGVAKTAWPHLQAINISGAAVSATNILDKIFDTYTEVRSRARGNANEILLSFKHLGSIMKIIETQKGGFKVSVNSTSASMYGWTEIEINSVKGQLKIVGIQEMPDDVIFFLDWSALKFYSNGMFKKRVAPDGKEYFEVRNTTGYQYIVDISLFGELVVHKPSSCGVLFSIPNY